MFRNVWKYYYIYDRIGESQRLPRLNLNYVFLAPFLWHGSKNFKKKSPTIIWVSLIKCDLGYHYFQAKQKRFQIIIILNKKNVFLGKKIIGRLKA